MAPIDVSNRLITRFLRKVPHRPPDGCWLWGAGRFPTTGYGAFSVDGQNRGAHRVAYTIWVGPIPDGLMIDHECRVRECVNPAHLRAVTSRVNTLENTANRTMLAHAAGTCAAGLHDMSDVYVKPDGERQCRPCQLEKGRARRRAAGMPEAPHIRGTCGSGLHDMSDAYVDKRGRRQCRPCTLDRERQKRHPKKS